MFDGLLRPLSSWGDFIEPGTSEGITSVFSFRPTVQVGDHVVAGGQIGTIELGGGRIQRCMTAPTVGGTVTDIAPTGDYRVDATICTVSQPGQQPVAVTMTQRWPLRQPRPVTRRRAPDEPMLTGQRILDTLFPVARGGRAALPGGFGTGKTVLQQALAKFADADVVVYVGCGERGNEITEVLEEFPELEDPRTGRPLLERTVVIANTSNMPVAAREASIYTGVTVAEYFRDQGLHVALMADSTSRWAEALREVSGRLGELPAESGYPAYLSSRLAEFYERAGSVDTLAGDRGSLTIIAAVSPPGGDFSEPVTKHSQRYVRCMWSLDPVRAHARLYPAIHPLTSYSEDVSTLADWWESGFNPRWSEQRRKLLVLLEQQAELERMARIVGKDSMPQRQRLVLLCAELATDAFLSQSALSPVDARCSPARQTAMLRLISRFTSRAQAALDRGVRIERVAALPIVRRLQRMGEEIGEDDLPRFDELAKTVEHAFANLEGSPTHAS
jgi:V/A-type H+-transporting ATPase subunit A